VQDGGVLMLLDSASLYYRAYFGVPESVTAPDGTPVNAVRGFLDMIATLVTAYRPTGGRPSASRRSRRTRRSDSRRPGTPS